MTKAIEQQAKRRALTFGARRNFSKRVAILAGLIFSTSAASFVWGATSAAETKASTEWENTIREGATLYDVDAYNDDVLDGVLDGEEPVFAEAPIPATEAPAEVNAEASPTEETNVGYSLHVHDAETHETHETHVKHVEEASAFRLLLDKLELGATITAVGQQSDYEAVDSGIDGSLMVEVEAFAELTERDSMRATFKVGMGEGLGARIPSFCGLNAASGATRNTYLNQLWYERKFGDGDRWRARVGYLDLTSDFDTNAYANDEYCQFLSDAFVNNITFECPANALGGQIWWTPNDKWHFGVGYSESDRDCVEMFSRGVAIAEIDRHVQIGELQGTYRGYFTTNFTPRESLDGSRDDLVNDGWGLSFDQEISRYIGLWGRYGQQNGECCEFDRALTCGFELHSCCEERPDDILGFGYGITYVSDDFKALNENAVDEKHVELYYSIQVNKYFSATPSLQWIDGVGGDGEAEVVWAPGFRATVAF